MKNPENDKELFIRQASAPCKLGWVLAGTTEKGICFIALDDVPDTLVATLTEHFPHAHITPATAEFSTILQTIVAFIDGLSTHWQLPLDIQGTAFQQQVWSALATIPAGTTLSYRELAARIGRPTSIRAAANACGANPLAVIIPCHRVIRSDGSLGGYRWGIKRKKILLEREART